MDEAAAPSPILTSQQLGDVVAQMREGFQVIGSDWRYLFVNDEVCRQGRRTAGELLGRTMQEVYPGIDATPMFERLARCMRDRVTDSFENEFGYRDGSTAWFELRIQPVPQGIAILSLDITERRSLEVQLRQAQKMEAIGRLAGGIAHDFNNLLTAITTFGELASQGAEGNEQVLSDIEELLRASKRATGLAGQLLAFSRRQTVRPRVIDINEHTSQSITMIRRVVGDDISVRWIPHEALDSVRIDPSALDQVILNLVINARDAMPRGGTLTLETGIARLGGRHRMAKDLPVVAGDYIMLAVSDEGCGMDDATIARLFEPFFTTKVPGLGTGLGLSTCYGIVRQAGGYVWVYSEPGRGSTFKIYLPRVRTAAEPATEEKVERDTRGHESILVAEDDAQVRDAVVRVLAERGYRVGAATDGLDALRCYEELGSVDLLLSDVVMPRMGGRELAVRLRWVQPSLKVLYISGYTEHGIANQADLGGSVELLEKPFSIDALASRVRAVLDRSA